MKNTKKGAVSPASGGSYIWPTEYNNSALICFSHLRWEFVFQRPQHLMTRMSQTRPTFFWEEPVLDESCTEPKLAGRRDESGVVVLTPTFAAGTSPEAAIAGQRALLDEAIRTFGLGKPVLWYYTPMSLAFSDHVEASAVIYDCMDELSLFKGAPPELGARESQLMARADLVFTGGHSLYRAKRHLHDAIHPFPSSVDVAHFAKARSVGREPAGREPVDQAAIPHPRVGFAGVIDERMDIELLAALADHDPSRQIVMIGPVVKIDPASLPRRPNIHYLGGKPYKDLPLYMAGWQAALLPFALNDSTRFISPTKTPEYLAAGLPVVSTAITDVVTPYEELGLVRIGRSPAEFCAALDELLAAHPDATLRESADRHLGTLSWDSTFSEMRRLIEGVLHPRPVVANAAAANAASPLRPALRQAAGTKAAPIRLARPDAAGPERYDYLVVGAGFAGSVMAERLAAASGKRVLVVDRREHIGGNAYDHTDAAGLLVHRYGPHIFHTNSDDVFAYLSRFTKWRAYEHRVLARVRDQLVPIPINRTTIERLYGLDLEPEALERFYAERAEAVAEIRNSEDVIVSRVGRELYELFFRGYTRKQWGLDPSQLDKAVTARVPTRDNRDDRYFTDSHQAMPRDGYTRMFERMLDHPNITVRLGVDYSDLRGIEARETIFTGPIDEYFGYRHGPLPYRSLRFGHVTLPIERHQPVAVVNYPDQDVPYTRITEYKHLTGQQHPMTSISYEYPSAVGDPYYPIPMAENQALFKKYQALADRTPGVHFVGRLATYRYYNMDQVVGQALALHRRLHAPHSVGRVAAEAAVSP